MTNGGIDAEGVADAIRAQPAERVEEGDAPRHAGVALVFRSTDSGPDLLFIQRAEFPGDPWSGHMAFPGGHKESTDSSARAAAVRETAEEVGIPLGQLARPVGVLDAVYSPAQLEHRIAVQPYAFWCDASPPIEPNSEVAGVHWIPVQSLLDGVGRGFFSATWEDQSYTLPCIDWEGQRVWGMTLRIVDDLLERLRTHFPTG